MTNGLRNYKRHMVTRYAGKCTVCEVNTVAGKDFAAVDANGKWHGYCALCASSFALQVQRVLPTVEAAYEALTVEQRVQFDADVKLPGEDDIVKSLSGEAEGLAFDTLVILMYARAHARNLSGIDNDKPAVRANKYDGKCATCYNHVPAGAGRIEKQGAKWLTYHLDGQCPTVKGEAPVVVPAGRYAVPSATGNNDLDFFEVDHGKAGTKWEGYVFVSRIIGGHTEGQRINRAQQAAALKAISADVDTALRTYGRTVGKCGHCGRLLTDETSRAEGIGPVCAGRR